MLRRRGKQPDADVDEDAGVHGKLSTSPMPMSPELEREEPFPEAAKEQPSPSQKPRRMSTLPLTPRRFTRRLSRASSIGEGMSRSRSFSSAASFNSGTARDSARQAPSSSSSTLPLLLTFVVPLMSFMTGGDFLRDVVLLLFLVFYLHQLIKVPWELYLSARPRHSRRTSTSATVNPDGTSTDPPVQSSAQSHLHLLELTYLSLSVLSPLLGSLLLRSITLRFGMGDTPLSWFSTTLFAFIAGLRPWNHLVERVRGHTEGLHDEISEEQRLSGLDAEAFGEDEDDDTPDLEEQLEDLKEKLDKLEQVNEDLKASLTLIERRTWKLERDRLRDRKAVEGVEGQIAELGREVSLDRHAQVTAAVKKPPPQIRQSYNPVFHPILFTRTVFASIWALLLVPVIFLFPSLRPREQHRERTIHFRLQNQRKKKKLDTIDESDEEEEMKPDMTGESIEMSHLVTKQSANGKVDDAEVDSDELEDLNEDEGEVEDLDLDPKVDGVQTHPQKEGTLHIVFWTPASAVYNFVTGVLKHGL